MEHPGLATLGSRGLGLELCPDPEPWVKVKLLSMNSLMGWVQEEGGINPAAAYAKVAQACTDFLKSHGAAELLAEPDAAGVELGEEEAAEVKLQAEQLERDSAWVWTPPPFCLFMSG